MNMKQVFVIATLSSTIIAWPAFSIYKQQNKQDTPITYHTHAQQTVYSDGSDVNTDFDTVKWQNINFDQTFKKIYLSNKNDYITADRSMISLKQTNICSDNNDTGTCGGKGYKWDINTRVHDWTNDFHDNLYLHLSNDAPEFGYSKQKLYLKEKKLLNNKQSFHSLTCPTKFGTLYEHANDINFNVGIHRDLTSGGWNVYGVNKALIKETAHVAVFYNWVDRFLWTMNAGDTPHQSGVGCPDNGYSPINVDGGGINIGSYNINNLLKISKPNYQTKTIKLIINDEFINFIKLWHDELKNKPLNELNDIQKQLMSKYEISNKDDPWLILKDVQNKLIFNIEYRISDPIKVNEFKTQQIKISFDSLVGGVDIHLNKNQNDKYLVQFSSIKTLEIVEPDLYIQECKTSNIDNTNQQIEHNDNNFFELLSPSIENIKFKNFDADKLKDIYPSSLSDISVLQTFLTLIDSYGGVDNYSLLTNQMYQIKRNDLDGEITINVDVNDIHLNKTFNCFKRADEQTYELDASKVAYNIVPEELNGNRIGDIFLANGFSGSVVNDLCFDVIGKDNVTGVANIKITKGLLLDKIYEIKNLQPYFIAIKKNINKKYLQINPSEVNVDELKRDYLEISNEFWSRNNESLSFVLEPNNKDKILLIRISYFEEFDHKYNKVDLTINFLQRKTNHIFIWVIIGLALITVGVFVCIFYKKIQNRRNAAPGTK